MSQESENNGNWSLEYSHSIKFTWNIPNFSTINAQQLCSDAFSGGDHEWAIVIYPDYNNYLSVYLRLYKSESFPNGYTRRITCCLSVINEVHMLTVKKEFHETLTVSERNDCGYSSFISLDKLRQADKPFLVNDTCTIRAELWFNEIKVKAETNIEKKVDPKQVKLEESRKNATRQVDSDSRDDLLLKQCMKRLNGVKTIVNLQDYKSFVKTLVTSRDMRLAFMNIPDEIIVDFLKDLSI